MTKTFDPTRPVQTRDGRPARILATINNEHFPVIAVVTNDDGHEWRCDYTSSGTCYSEGPSPYDLINIPTKREGWVNVYLNPLRTGEIFATKQMAVKSANPGALGPYRLEWEE